MGQAKQKIVTSRELAESIDRLIVFRLARIHSKAFGERDKYEDLIELEKRDIADALKRLDHNGGVYVEGEHK